MVNLLKLFALFTVVAPSAPSVHKSISELPNANQEPRLITMSIYEDAKTQMAFNWNTSWKTDSILQVIEKATGDFSSSSLLEFNGTTTKSKVSGDGFIHQAVAKDLKENTTYLYRVGDKDANVWSDVGEFTTADDSHGVKFIHLSDPQGYEELHYNNYNELLNIAMENSKPDFFALTGDIVNDSYADSTPKLQQWEWAITRQKEVMQNVPFMTTPGNHEAADNDYNSRFNLPVPKDGYSASGSYYSFDYQGSHFISLNTNDTVKTVGFERGLSETQMKWLEQDLKDASASDFIIVMMHKGIYDAGGHCSNLDSEDGDIELIRNQLSPLFTKYNVDLVLQGHDHLYSRSYPLTGKIDNELVTTPDKEANKLELQLGEDIVKVYENPNGTIYLNSGTASGSKYYQTVDYDKEKIPLEATDSSNNRMYTEITIQENVLYAKVYKVINGKPVLYDTFGISKEINNNNSTKPEEKGSPILPIILISSGLVLVAIGAFICFKKNKEKGDVN